jgi:hypothetical protein
LTNSVYDVEAVCDHVVAHNELSSDFTARYYSVICTNCFAVLHTRTMRKLSELRKSNRQFNKLTTVCLLSVNDPACLSGLASLPGFLPSGIECIAIWPPLFPPSPCNVNQEQYMRSKLVKRGLVMQSLRLKSFVSREKKAQEHKR